MVANHIESTELEQRFAMKFLIAEKCKLCEIYKRIYDVYEKTCFSTKNIHKWAKHGFVTMSLSRKDSIQSGHFGKENIPDTAAVCN